MKKKFTVNTITAIFYQITVIVCGLILPKFIISSFGSNVNGLISSITQFISVIAFLDLGVGTVVQSSFYKPLSNNDNDGISRIYVSSNRFFKKIAIILVVYVCILMLVYPQLNSEYFDYSYIALLIFILSIDRFAQYYFGITNRLMLDADQHTYVICSIQIITVILNTVISIMLIQLGMGIHIVKLSTASIFLLRPIVWFFYVKFNYKINKKITLDEEPIKQKWNGLAQHVSAMVLDSTDVIVLTIFSTLSNVSIYTVYYMVVQGVRQLTYSLTYSATPVMGRLWATEDEISVNRFFYLTEWVIHTLTIVIYTCTFSLIVPFVSIYTLGVTDVDYFSPFFGCVLVVAISLFAFRLPYNMLILASGSFKETQKSYVVATVINIVTSVLMVNILGLVGVAIGTFCALFYQVVWQAIFVYDKLLKENKKALIKRLVINIVSFALCAVATSFFTLTELTYLSWVIMALKVFSITLLITAMINLIFYKDNILSLANVVRKKFSK